MTVICSFNSAYQFTKLSMCSWQSIVCGFVDSQLTKPMALTGLSITPVNVDSDVDDAGDIGYGQ